MAGATAVGAGRLLGVDAARGLAIVGMLAAHVGDDGSDDALVDGRSSVLFATLAGVSLGLLTGGPRPVPPGERWPPVSRIALRGVLLIVLGLLLWLLRAPVAVILDTYGALFLVLLPALFAPRWALALLVAAGVLVGPAVIAGVGEDLATPFSSARLQHLPAEWFVTGYYPGVLWIAYLAAGLLAARLDLTRRATQLRLLVAGGVASITGYAGAGLLGADASAHSNSTGEALGSGGLALAVVALLQLVCSAPATAAPARRVLHPLIAAGAMPLTLYTLQLIAIALFLTTPLAGSPPSMASWPLLGLLVAGSLAFAMLWRRLVGRGPLETAMAELTRVPALEAPDRRA